MVEASLSKTVQFLIEHEPSIQDALERGYANYSAVARLLKPKEPKVEKILGKKVTIEGMITAVKRAKIVYAQRKEYQKIIVAKISLEKNRKILEKARLASADFPEAFFQVLEGATVLTLITDQSIFDEVRSVFKKDEILEEKRDLAAIIVQSPRGIVDTPGCIASFYNPLSRGQINIEETISCFTETVIVVKMEDAARAFSLLTDLISNVRKILASS
ncbi:hypothetical protein B6U79_04755 [Candidatus Bathyarchaeota archaeon ex4484_231]|nr:MAG: hypothetical protein B6U79_04755 [Candidatus Bathyarchaeota archaeon ex4484_231]